MNTMVHNKEKHSQYDYQVYANEKGKIFISTLGKNVKA